MVQTTSILTWVRVLAFAIAIQVVSAQKCYYPNGKEADSNEKPCSSADGSACCPQNWQCLDNGMCYYPPTKLHGRYSCTDQSWKASGCPSNLCTYNLQGVGGENMQQCSNHTNQWCCNADDVNVKCCGEWPQARPFFSLPDGKAYATIGSTTASSAPNLATFTGLAVAASGGSSANPSSAPASSAPNSARGSSTAASSSLTSVQTLVSSGTAGVFTTVVTSVVQVAGPTAAAGSSSSSSSNSKLPIIIGCAVGIPLGLALAAILLWLLHKRRQQKKTRPESLDPYDDTSSFAAGAKAKLQKPQANGADAYKSEAAVPELAGQSIGPGRPISTIKGRAELPSGGAFAPGTVPPAPHLVGVGGGHTPQSSWGSAPPGYSPAMNQAAWTPVGHGTNVSELDAANEKSDGPGTLVAGAPTAPTTEGGRYVPYRPPQGHAAHLQGQHLSDVPEASELSTVRTPPA